MAFVAINSPLGEVDLTSIDTAGPGYYNLITGTGSGRMNFALQQVQGYDPNLGGGWFVYCKYAGTVAAGTVCEITPSLVNGAMVDSATPWAGTANTGKPLCVALVAGVAGNFGWFQIEGNAIVTVQGAPAAGNPVYWQAAGVVSPTAVAGKQMVSAQFATGVSQTLGTGNAATVLGATTAIVHLGAPCAQTQIT